MADLSQSERAKTFRAIAHKVDQLSPIRTALLSLADLWDAMDVPNELSSLSAKSQIVALLDHADFSELDETDRKRLKKARISSASEFEKTRQALLDLIGLTPEQDDSPPTEIPPVLQNPANKIVPLEDGQWLVTPDTPEDLEAMLAKFESFAAETNVLPEPEVEQEADHESDDPRDTVRPQTEEERIAFVLSYSVAMIPGFLKDWTVERLTSALEAEAAGKNRKTAKQAIERAIRKRTLQDAEDKTETVEVPPEDEEPAQVSPEEEQRVADEAVMCQVCYKHRALYVIDGTQLCAICAHDELEPGKSAFPVETAEEPTSDPTPEANGEQLPLLPETSPSRPDAMILGISRLVDQVEHIPTPPQSFVDSMALVQLNPILVRKRGEKYIVVDGRRRIKALQAYADRKGLDYKEITIRAEVFDADSWSHDSVMAIKANTERSPNILNELKHIEDLIAQGYTEKQIGLATGMKLTTIRKRLKLTQLTPDLRQALDAGRIKPGVAGTAVSLPKDKQNELAAQEGRITGNDVQEAKQVKVEVLADLLDGFEQMSEYSEPVESHLDDVQLQALIESNTGVLRNALIELRTWRARYSTQEKSDGRTESQEAVTV